MSGYEIRLEVFEGPIDLLLHLITRQRVDIYEVSLATITEEYLAAMRRMEGLDLESATSFLVIAATLLELKSARLLPAGSSDEVDDRLLEERDLLLAKLVEVSTFREAGAFLGSSLAAGDAFFGRSVTLDADLAKRAPDVMAGIDGPKLARAAALALAPRPVPVLDTSHVAPAESVQDAVAEVAGVLKERGTAGFTDLCAGAESRLGVIVRFLALLELFKMGAVDLTQLERFGTIKARWTGDVDELTLVAEVDEYAMGQGGADGSA